MAGFAKAFVDSMERASRSKTQIKGEKTVARNRMMGETARATGSVNRTANIFGPISPKTRRMRTTTPVAIPIPAFPNRSMARDVAMEAAPTFTRVFAMRTVMMM